MSATHDEVVKTCLADAVESWDGTLLPRYPQGTPKVSIIRVTIPPHVRLASHTHPVINAGVVLRGELTVVAANGAERTFRTGEAIVELVGMPHYGENRGHEAVELLMFYAGTEDLPLSVTPQAGGL